MSFNAVFEVVKDLVYLSFHLSVYYKVRTTLWSIACFFVLSIARPYRRIAFNSTFHSEIVNDYVIKY